MNNYKYTRMPAYGERELGYSGIKNIKAIVLESCVDQ